MSLLPTGIQSASGSDYFAPMPESIENTTTIPVPTPTLVSGVEGEEGAIYSVAFPITTLYELKSGHTYLITLKCTVTPAVKGILGDLLRVSLIGANPDEKMIPKVYDFVNTINLSGMAAGVTQTFTITSLLDIAPPILFADFTFLITGTPTAYVADISYLSYTLIGKPQNRNVVVN